MATSTNKDEYVYFIYSEQQEKLRKEVEAKIGREFKCGLVVVRGLRVPFTEMNITGTSRFPDAKLVAQGIKSRMKYTDIRITTIRRKQDYVKDSNEGHVCTL